MKVGSGVWTGKNYVYDAEDILMEYSDSGVVGNRYVHGPGIDDPLAARVGSTNYYFFKDAQGSIVEVVQGYNSVYNSFIYDTYGNMVRFCGGGCGTLRAVYNGDVPGDLSIPYRYTGREWDDETGLYYYRARYYDPSVGRFLSKDPIGFEGGWNLYAYVNGNPVNYTDPSGTVAALAIPVVIGAEVIIEAAVAAITAVIVAKKITNTKIKTGDVATPLPGPPNKERRDHCMRLYLLCKNGVMCGPCDTCYQYCLVQDEWPFHMCNKINGCSNE